MTRIYSSMSLSETQSREMIKTSTITSKGRRRAMLTKKHYFGYVEGKFNWYQVQILRNTHQRDEVKILIDILVDIRLKSPYTKVLSHYSHIITTYFVCLLLCIAEGDGRLHPDHSRAGENDAFD